MTAIVFNEHCETQRDKYQWVLTHKRKGLSKLGEVIYTPQISYHGTLAQVAKEVNDRLLGECSTIAEVLEALEKFSKVVEGLKDPPRKEILDGI